MTINEKFIKFLMWKFKYSFDEAMVVYREYLVFRLKVRDGLSEKGGKK